jgi:hypothetical protein
MHPEVALEHGRRAVSEDRQALGKRVEHVVVKEVLDGVRVGRRRRRALRREVSGGGQQPLAGALPADRSSADAPVTI